MSVETRLEALRAKHAELEAAIAAENHRPLPDSTFLSDLKRQKLKIKEEIERLRT
ncbi:MAG: hypothetical protein FD153_1223 [Rhodospirillaceae bacterium]|nr:MAG: hypothetical protein FD153_1223 [Rhodospirillaceae bacterium]